MSVLSKKPLLLCLMGPTGIGKTDLAIELTQTLPLEIISVDSAMIYCGLDIGTAKPPQILREHIPHHFIDIRDPREIYSVGDFCEEVLPVITDIHTRGRIPLLVGGTMLYFHVLQQGLANLPKADDELRNILYERGKVEGWPKLHAELQQLDPQIALRIKPNDRQRIQRALEVYMLTGKPLSLWQQENINALSAYKIINIVLWPKYREELHHHLAERFQAMLKLGLIEEVEMLYERGDLTTLLPAIRSVGYRQVWSYLAGEMTYAAMEERAIIASRQLAKRQMTWLKHWSKENLFIFYEKKLIREYISDLIEKEISACEQETSESWHQKIYY